MHYGFEHVFERQVEGLAQGGDVAIGITTSGKSENVILGIKKAKELGATTVLLTGKNSPECPVDFCIRIVSDNTPVIQEGHEMVGHMLCYLVENKLSGN